MHIIKLEAENIKKLRAVSITPDGNVVQITGANGAGKTSVLDAIFYALAGKGDLPSQPIRRGESDASVRVDLGDYIVRREFNEAGTRLYVESQDGARFPSPQKLLDGLLGELTFDPLSFTRMEPKAQLETLRRLVKLDVDVDHLDRLNLRDYENRREINRRVASLKERVRTLEEGLRPSTDVTPTDVSEITAKMEEASNINSGIERERMGREQRGRQIAELLDVAARKGRDAVELRRRADALYLEVAQFEARAKLLEHEAANEPLLADPVDVAELRERINIAIRSNQQREQQRQQRAKHEEAMKSLEAAESESDALSGAIEERTRAKSDAIAAAAMPVPGLGFGDGQVTYNDVPFEQASAAEQLRVSFAMAMAANPKLKVVLIRDGSLLDEHSLALVAAMAEEHDFQVWLEKAEIGGRVGILMEDGAIAAIDGTPVTQDAVAAD